MVQFASDGFGLRELKLAVSPDWAGGTIGLEPARDHKGLLCMWAGYVDGYSLLTKDEALALAAELTAWANKSDVL